eukprot:TRINITY_DN946_c0_g2_i2.p1 TRINITY_DN946_c0_g2~~TRINITY_DN946_c0_g2_i2.p1  ORF type:complete len:180 (+),score=47.43 TRINITY_DN946_c0_g2_i2:66-542(+)
MKTELFVNVTVSRSPQTSTLISHIIERNIPEEEQQYNSFDIPNILVQSKVNLFYQLFQEGFSKEQIQLLQSNLLELNPNPQPYKFDNKFVRKLNDQSSFLSNSTHYMHKQMPLQNLQKKSVQHCCDQRDCQLQQLQNLQHFRIRIICKLFTSFGSFQQ